MALTLRNTKGSALTYTEMDDNFTFLDDKVNTLSLSDVLTSGNTTGANDILISNGQKINAASGGGQLDLRYGVDNQVSLKNSTNTGLFLDAYGSSKEILISTDGEVWNESYSYFTPDQAEMGTSGSGSCFLQCKLTLGITLGETGVINPVRINIFNSVLKFTNLPIYADNAAATTGGLPVDAVYKTSTGELRIVV